MPRSLETATLDGAARHYAGEWMRPDRRSPSDKLFVGGPSYVLQDHDELVARVEENNWDAEIAKGLNDDTDSVSLTQGVKREFVAGRCPAIYGSGDYKGSQCKFSTRQFTVYCGSHNKCVQCNKKCTDDWPKCVACEPDAPRPPPKKKRAKPKEDLQ